jgi:hypothetical protein
VRVGGHDLDEGDGAAVFGERTVEISGRSDAEVLVFDLA